MRTHCHKERGSLIAAVFVAAAALSLHSFGCGGQRKAAPGSGTSTQASRVGTARAPGGAVTAAEDHDLTADAQLSEAVFRQLFAFRGHSLQGERANLFFVGMGDFNDRLTDPAPAVLSALQTTDARVLAQSHSSFDVQKGVRHRRTDEAGLLFYAESGCVRGNEAFVRAGYVEHGKSGMRFIFFLRHMDGAWRLVEVGRTAVS